MAGSAISPLLLKQVDKAAMDDSRVFARGSPFSIGMDDWSEDPPEAESDSGKRKRLKLSLSRPPSKWRFSEIASEKELDKASKGVVPKNTEKNDRWALGVCRAWITERNRRCVEKCPDNLLEQDDTNAELMSKWLSLFVLEVRKSDGSKYPPQSIHLILCGLQALYATY